jgi:hypothetical protein
MINNEYKNSSEVYKVQTFRTTQFAASPEFDREMRIKALDPITSASSPIPHWYLKMTPFEDQQIKWPTII